ncbi:hypothetical protein IKG45_02430 [Candidatus Saccharibacteria bacterium]|nr:hypothetical protein [Candidatus Saccharibacteria bacterium]
MSDTNLETEIKNIKARNVRVELDKNGRLLGRADFVFVFLTYIVVVIYSFTIQKVTNVFLSSLVPVIGFTLSTLSLRFVRKIWEKRIKK